MAAGQTPSFLVPEAYKDFFEHTHDLAIIFRADGRILQVNAAWKNSLEYREADLPHLTLLNMIHPKDKNEFKAICRIVVKDSRARKFFGVFLARSGYEVIVEGTLSGFLSQSKAGLLLGLFRDVTQNKEYERLKSEFISTISHELRTPLTIIREGVAQVEEGFFGTIAHKQKMIFDMVLKNTDRLSRNIEELLDISKLEVGQVRLQRSFCNMVDLVQEVIADFRVIAVQKNLKIQSEYEKEKIELYVDRQQIIKVLTNLVNNALKFTDKGSIKIYLDDGPDFVECKVMDTGKGIMPHDMPRVFETFSQFDRRDGPGDRGTGLGLAICKKLIELHHGRMKIHSSAKEGTQVSFSLPKYVPRDFFKNTIDQAILGSEREKKPLSVIIFDLIGLNNLRSRIGENRVDQMVARIEPLINQALRRAADFMVRDARAILVLLPDTSKNDAHTVMGRLTQLLEECFACERKMPKVDIRGTVACYPEDAENLEKILDKLCT